MNKWQEYFLKEYYNGKKPRDKVGKLELELLGQVREKVTIHFPKFESPIESQCHEAHSETFTVTEDDCNMPEGIISVSVLAGNLRLWTSRGYEIEY